MPQAVMNTPTDPVAGTSVDLSGYDFAKTFVVTGDPGFDALIEVANNETANQATAWLPIGRLKGNTATVVEGWMYHTRLRRIDGTQTPASVVVQGNAHNGRMDLAIGFQMVGTDADLVVTDDVEPFTVWCYNLVDGVSADLIVSGGDVGAMAPIAQLGKSQMMNIGATADYQRLNFKGQATDDPEVPIYWLWIGKTPNVVVTPNTQFVAFELAHNGTDVVLQAQSPNTDAQVLGLTNPVAGAYEVQLSSIPPAVISGSRLYVLGSFYGKGPGGPVYLTTNYVGGDIMQVRTYDAAGVLTNMVNGDTVTIIAFKG